MKQRTINKITSSPLHTGFLGEGHMAAAVVDGTRFEETDPFILLMDDQLDLPGGKPVGGPHPHAGFETVTLILQGDGKEWETGSLELMTAGKGIIHTEEITAKTKMRILQLWLVLPPEKRWTDPFHQLISLENVPTLKTTSSEIRVYSGSSNGLTSPLQNHTPLTLVDFIVKKKSEVVQQLPTLYNGFIYVIEGSVSVGVRKIESGQTGWLDISDISEESEINFSVEDLTRFVLYAGKPHHASVVSYGPFIGDTKADIQRLYHEYHQGLMPHLSELPESKKIRHILKGA